MSITIRPPQRGCPCRQAAALLLVASACLSLQARASAQVTVGYSNPILATASFGLEQRRAVRETEQFGVAGLNVRPEDGSLIYDENTIWRIDQPGRPFSLTITESSPLLELQRSDITSRSAEVSRIERVYVQVSGPAADALQSVFPVRGIAAADPTQATIPLSVFTP